MSSDRLKNTRVCVTGGNGFLGRQVLSSLSLTGAHVFAPSRREVDLRNRSDVVYMLEEYAPQVVIHLAANVGGIGLNMDMPANMFYDNAMMGLNVLHQSWAFGVEKLVMVGTVCSYPKYTLMPFVEENFWSGYPEETNAAYGIAKKMMLTGMQAYRQQYEFDGIYLILANLYGPEDDFDPYTSHAIPAIIRKIHEAKITSSKAVRLWGDGTPTRDFIHVREAARAVVLAADRYSKPEPVNIGSGLETSIREIAERVARILDYTGEIVWDTSKPNGQQSRVLYTARAEQEFGFKNGVTLEHGLKETVKWYLKNGWE